MNQAIDNPTDLITEGSVWKSRTRDFSVRVLATTNTTLIGTKVEDQFPCRVVYVNPQNNVFDRVVDEFIEQFVFFNVDPVLEQRIQGLFDPDLEETESDEPEAEAESDGDAENDFALKDTPPEEQTSPFVALFSYADGAEGVTVAPESLALSCTGYEVFPDFASGTVFHHLHFDANITYDDLVRAFSASPDNAHPVIDLITLAGDADGMAWDTFGGIFPSIIYGERFHKVILATSTDDEVSSTPELQVETIGAGSAGTPAPEELATVVVDDKGAADDRANVFGVSPDDGVFGDVSGTVQPTIQQAAFDAPNAGVAGGTTPQHPGVPAPVSVPNLDVSIAH